MYEKVKPIYRIRQTLALPVRALGAVLLPVLLLFLRLFKIKASIKNRLAEVSHFLGLIALGLIVFVLLLFWLRGQTWAILILHSWATLIFSRCTAYLRLKVIPFWRNLVIFLQIAFLITLISLPYALSLPIAVGFLLIAKLYYLGISENIRLYTQLLGQDHFDAHYWWRKKKSPHTWVYSIQLLLEKQFHNSIADIIGQYLLRFRDIDFQISYAPVIFDAWVKLRKYQILPDDIVLQQSHKLYQKNDILYRQGILGTACNFELIAQVLVMAEEKSRYGRLLIDFSAKLAVYIENYVQKPYSIHIPQFLSPDFEEDLDKFIAQKLAEVSDADLKNSLEYSYGLLFMAAGVARNF